MKTLDRLIAIYKDPSTNHYSVSLAFEALLSALSREELLELRKTPEGSYYDIRYRIDSLLNPPKEVSVRSETLSALMKMAVDKEGKKMGYAKRKLMQRIKFVSYSEQMKILNLFFGGTKTDKEWAFSICTKLYLKNTIPAYFRMSTCSKTGQRVPRLFSTSTLN